MGRAGSDPWQTPSLQPSDSWHLLYVGLAALSCSVLLTCPSALYSSSCCLGMKCFFCYTNIQRCQIGLEFLFLPQPSILVPLCLCRDDMSSPRDIQQWHVIYRGFFFLPSHKGKPFSCFSVGNSRGIGFGSSMRMSSQHKCWVGFWNKKYTQFISLSFVLGVLQTRASVRQESLNQLEMKRSFKPECWHPWRDFLPGILSLPGQYS